MYANIHRIIIHPDDPNTVYVGAQGNAWAESEDRGVFKTIDGGKTWSKLWNPPKNSLETNLRCMVLFPKPQDSA